MLLASENVIEELEYRCQELQTNSKQETKSDQKFKEEFIHFFLIEGFRDVGLIYLNWEACTLTTYLIWFTRKSGASMNAFENHRVTFLPYEVRHSRTCQPSNNFVKILTTDNASCP